MSQLPGRLSLQFRRFCSLASPLHFDFSVKICRNPRFLTPRRPSGRLWVLRKDHAMNCFADRLAAAVRRSGNPVLVGLDPRADMLPGKLAPAADAGWAEIADAFAAILPGSDRRRRPAGAGGQAASGLLRAIGAVRHDGLGRSDSLRPRGQPGGHSRRQAQRHRLDRHRLRPGLSRPRLR